MAHSGSECPDWLALACSKNMYEQNGKKNAAMLVCTCFGNQSKDHVFKL